MLSKYAAKSPSPSNPSGCWIADSSLARFLGFWPKTAQAQGPHPEIELIKPAAAPPTGPNPFLATPGGTTIRDCTGSKLGFHSRPPQIRRMITVQKPNTMLIKSATHTSNKNPHPIQGNENQSFKGKRLLKAQKAAKPSPNPIRPPGPQQPCLSNREPVIPRWMPGL